MSLSVADKPRRMDIRLTNDQRTMYERAASYQGQTLTQWATSHLDDAAEMDILSASTTCLSPDAFDDFCEMLEAPLPAAAQDLLNRKPIWE